MSFERNLSGSDQVPPEPLGRGGGLHEERRTRSTKLADGTLACPSCDAPVAGLQRPMSPVEPLWCGFCAHEGPLRDFLSLAPPTRPTRVTVHVRSRLVFPSRASRV